MVTKYDKMRQDKFVEVNDKRQAELERLVISNGFKDQEDSGLVKTYTWHAGKQTIVARYSKRRLDQLRQRMGQVDGVLAKYLLEISRVYRDEKVALWQAHDEKEGLAQKQLKSAPPQAMDLFTAKEAEILAFMRRQVDCHAALAGVPTAPTTKTELKLAELRKQALGGYWTAAAMPYDGSEIFKGGRKN